MDTQDTTDGVFVTTPQEISNFCIPHKFCMHLLYLKYGAHGASCVLDAYYGNNYVLRKRQL
jgi:hypothetical protein